MWRRPCQRVAWRGPRRKKRAPATRQRFVRENDFDSTRMGNWAKAGWRLVAKHNRVCCTRHRFWNSPGAVHSAFEQGGDSCLGTSSAAAATSRLRVPLRLPTGHGHACGNGQGAPRHAAARRAAHMRGAQRPPQGPLVPRLPQPRHTPPHPTQRRCAGLPRRRAGQRAGWQARARACRFQRPAVPGLVKDITSNSGLRTIGYGIRPCLRRIPTEDDEVGTTIWLQCVFSGNAAAARQTLWHLPMRQLIVHRRLQQAGGNRDAATWTPQFDRDYADCMMTWHRSCPTRATCPAAGACGPPVWAEWRPRRGDGAPTRRSRPPAPQDAAGSSGRRVLSTN